MSREIDNFLKETLKEELQLLETAEPKDPKIIENAFLEEIKDTKLNFISARIICDISIYDLPTLSIADKSFWEYFKSSMYGSEDWTIFVLKEKLKNFFLKYAGQSRNTRHSIEVHGLTVNKSNPNSFSEKEVNENTIFQNISFLNNASQKASALTLSILKNINDDSLTIENSLELKILTKLNTLYALHLEWLAASQNEKVIIEKLFNSLTS